MREGNIVFLTISISYHSAIPESSQVLVTSDQDQSTSATPAMISTADYIDGEIDHY
jgi:hypothetical protein